MSDDPPTPRSRSLTVLAEDLRRARHEVRQLRGVAVPPRSLASAHESLLVAMERYAAELAALSLPVPTRLRDDLRLQRSIRGHRRG
ncbi:hypothetical protein GCM10027039_09520 [Terrabacter koreensis]